LGIGKRSTDAYSASDVQAAVNFAKYHNLKLVVRIRDMIILVEALQVEVS
jgi:hypothetical protein